MLRVSEIFYSIQGEGPNIGKPAVFLRMALCNLSCSWCDTPYTWDWNRYSYEKEVAQMSQEEVLQRILTYRCEHLVLTGGEPMLQQHELLPLLIDLKRRRFYIEVETNGTVSPLSDMLERVDQWNVSPKLENSGNTLASREKPECYRFFKNLENAFFKYVIQVPEDLREVQQLIEKYDLPSGNIIIMPEARNPSELSERSKWLVDVCKQRGYRFTTRLQLELWGNTRGT